MRTKYTILAANYPFMDKYEESFECATLWVALNKFREYKRRGYEIIDVHYREIIRVDTSNWDHITMIRGD